MAERVAASNPDLTARIVIREPSGISQEFPAPAPKVAVRGSGEDTFFDIAIGSEEISALLTWPAIRDGVMSLNHDQPGSVPVEQLQPVGALRAEHEHGAPSW
jgi:hypothetical protein